MQGMNVHESSLPRGGNMLVAPKTLLNVHLRKKSIYAAG